MPNISQLIKMLQSPKPNQQYDACEQMRVSPQLPSEAIKALRSVTSDENPDVADATRRAIALQSHSGQDESQNCKQYAGIDIPRMEATGKNASLFIKSRQQAILVWILALPGGWLLGWAIGSAIAYSNFTLHTSIPQNRIQVFREQAATHGGNLGGVFGLFFGWTVALAITLLALRSVIPTLKASQILWTILWATLPMALFLLAAVGGL